MKERIVLALFIIFVAAFFAFQRPAESRRVEASKKQTLSEIKPQTVRATAVSVSAKVSSFAPAKPEDGQSNKKTADEKARQVPNNLPFRKQSENAARDTEKNFARASAETMPAPALSFDGLSSNDNAAAYGFRMVPPDPFGDVGPNHYVQAVNSLVRVYDKNGNALTPPFKLSSLFAPLGTPCSTRNDGDPVVLYDALADRWLISQFCTQFPPFRQMFAVSAGSDPTGKYYIYEFVMPNVKLNDYSKIGVWSDGLYMATDQFYGSDYAGTGVFAFDKTKMLTGDPAAGYIYFDLATPSTIRLGGLLPTDFDGINAPPANAPNIFVGYAATEYGDANDAVRLFDFHADFRNPANSTFTERAESPLTVAPFDPTSPDGRGDISQPAPGEQLDAQSDRLMYRAAYRNFGTRESLIFNQTVRTSPNGADYRAGVRVYELSKSNGAFDVREQATVGNDGESRWMGSVAQDYQGNIAVGYSFVNDEKKPSVFYSGKLASEPGGVFRSEAALVAGTGVQMNSGSRWGDYSAMSIDPTDDCTFWLTNEYYAAESEAQSLFGWRTRIGKFKFAECTPAPRAVISGVVLNASNNQPIESAIVTANAVYLRSTSASGNFGNFSLLPETYTITASAKGFRSQTFTVSLTNGQTLIQNFALEPTAVLENVGTKIKEESCSVNNSVEPGETVTINIRFRNTGARNTANLTAALQPTGGVTNPSNPQNYGVTPTGGNSVLRPFTFTSAPDLACGEPITLTFELRDGAENLGTISVSLETGAKRIALQENFDSVATPDLPDGWTSNATGAQRNWATSTAQKHSAPNSAFSPNPNQAGVNELVSPVFQIVSPNAEVSFRNWYELESTFLRNKLYDGSVLEIKIGNDNWQDIEAAGGVFTSGGYDGVLDGCCQNPLAGRRAWSGISGVNQTAEFISSKAKLPASAAGNNVRLRWRVGTDIGTFRQGQYIDDLIVSDGATCSCRNAQQKRAPFDFDGDGKTDLALYRPNDNAGEADFLIQNSFGNSSQSIAWGSVGDVAVSSDYDGDGRTDYAVFRPSMRAWFILNSSNSSITTVYFGLADDRPTPADFDGDGKSDIAVFRPSNGAWYRLNSSNGQFFVQQFGTNGDLPVQADYDGDGKSDLAVFRPSNSVWYVLRSSDDGFAATKFGLNGDKPIVGDYDGDGKADFAAFRPADRNWYLLQSSQGFKAVNFGLSNDKLLQADFDGDGQSDIAVFRPSTNTWYYLKSSDGGVVVKSFGANGDTPIPSIFINQ
jgi:hypothetical protein